MANVSMNLLYNELMHVRKEVQELRSVFISEEGISEGERKELRSLFKEIEAGKGRSWREIRQR